MSSHLTFRFALLAAATTFGCSTTLPMNTGGDAGVGDMAMKTADGPAPVIDMAVVSTLTGTSVFTGQGLQLAGVTSDDWVVYLDNKNGANVVSIAGGASQSLTKSNTTYSEIRVVGKVVFASSNPDVDNNGDTVVWSSSSPAAKLNVKGASRNGVSSASPDGQYILYTDGATSSAVDLYVAKADASNPKLVLAGVAENAMCVTQLAFAGGKFIVSHCADGDTVATISTINPADGTVKDIRKGVRSFFTLDKAGAQMFVVQAAVTPTDDGGNPIDGGVALPSMGYVMGVDGSNPILVDTDVFYGFPQADGKAVIYGTNAPALKRSPIPISMPSVLTTMKFAGFATGLDGNLAASPDGKYIMTITSSSMSLSDIYLASTTVPGTPATLSAKATGCLFSDSFTADSAHALFYTTCVNSSNLLIGTFQTAPVAGGAPVMLGTKVWNNFATSKPSQVLFNDNWKAQKNTNGRADLKVADVSAAMPMSTLIVSQAEADFFLNHAKDKVIFAYAVDMTKAGIYTAPIP